MSCSSWACSSLLLGALACSRAPAQDLAINGAPPQVDTPVGAPPGPAEPGPELKNPFDGDVTAAQQGRILFEQFNCSCHGGRGGGGMGPSLRDGEWLYGSSDAALFGAIADGRAHGMPAWGSRIPERQIWQLVTYIRTLGSLVEPEAPSQIVPPPPFGP
ncbi:MAG TPA: c-type cytochrome [Polyangiales bacterium]|nr:c-type cytochrome [Polyangiales bacterium]